MLLPIEISMLHQIGAMAVVTSSGGHSPFLSVPTLVTDLQMFDSEDVSDLVRLSVPKRIACSTCVLCHCGLLNFLVWS